MCDEPKDLLYSRNPDVYSQAQVHMDTVLVIEDSRPMQRTLQRLFEGDSLEVHFASDGFAGIESFQKHTPSVIVLDLNLPGLSGKELCRSFKSLQPFVPIVILSANVEVEDKVIFSKWARTITSQSRLAPRNFLRACAGPCGVPCRERKMGPQP